jgi:hypothetical protein
LEEFRENVDFVFSFLKIWITVIKTDSLSSRNDFYKCLALMALAQQGKTIDERLLDNYVNRGLIKYL